MKRKFAAMMMAVVMTAAVTGCGNTEAANVSGTEAAANQSSGEQDGSGTQTENGEGTSAQSAEDSQYTVGISQFAEHGSLDNCREGFLAGLADAGIVEGENLTVLYDNAQADMATASTIADSYVSRKVDLICAVATPSAMTAYNAADGTGIPVIYTAVSDPAAAGLALEDKTSVGNITGTADTLPVVQQLEMIRELMPEAKKIGILYTTSETNSESTIAVYKEHAAEYGFEIIESGINTIADIPMAAADLVSKTDCLTNLTDNTVVSALQTVLDAAGKEGIPVFGSEIEQVKNGCTASMGLEYYELGRQTGAMAAKVLKQEAEAADMPYEVITEASLYVNTAAAEKINLPIPEGFTEKAVEVFE